MNSVIQTAKEIFFKWHPERRSKVKEEEVEEFLELIVIYHEAQKMKFQNRRGNKIFRKKNNHGFHKRLHLVKK